MGYRILSVLLAVAVVTGGIVAGWYGWEDYQGNRQWEQTRRELEGKGERLDFHAFIPPPVPEDQNVAFAPVFVRLYQYKVDPRTGLMTFNQEGSAHAAETVKTLPYGKGANPFPVRIGFQPWMISRALDLAKYQWYFRARQDFPRAPQPQTAAKDVWLALTRFGPLLDELAQAADQRPLGRFPIDWTLQPPSEIALPHGLCLQNLVITLQLHAAACLALGQTEEAWRDVALGFRLSRTLEAEPVLISRLVDIVCLQSLMQPVWEGLAEHRWSALQAAQLQAQFSRVDLIRDLQRAQRAERAGVVIPLADDMEQSRNLNQLRLMQTVNGYGGNDSIYRMMTWILRISPEGWFAQAKAVACRLDQQGVIDLVQPDSHHLAARESDEAAWAVHQLPMLPSTFIAKLVLPVSTNVAIKIAQTQAFVDEATVACALERYYSENHNYPEKLAELVPAWIERVPPDVIDGAPIRYQRTPPGSYRLWEVGWNGTDEGGKTAMGPGTTAKPDAREGDWVWQYNLAPADAGSMSGR